MPRPTFFVIPDDESRALLDAAGGFDAAIRGYNRCRRELVEAIEEYCKKKKIKTAWVDDDYSMRKKLDLEDREDECGALRGLVYNAQTDNPFLSNLPMAMDLLVSSSKVREDGSLKVLGFPTPDPKEKKK